MDDRPVREVDFEPSGPNWAILGAAAVLVLMLIGWALYAATGGDDAPAGASGEAASAPATPQTVEIRVEGGAAADITLDGRTIGPAPARLPIPADSAAHTLCAKPADGAPKCRQVTAAQLVAKPTLTLPL